MGEIIPGEEGELGGAGLFGDAILEGGPGLLRARVAEGLEETVEEGLRLALFIALQGFDEVEKGGDQRLGFGGRHGHAAFRGSGARGGARAEAEPRSRAFICFSGGSFMPPGGSAGRSLPAASAGLDRAALRP